MINILNTHSARWRDMHLDLPARHLHRFSGLSQENILRRVLLSQPRYGLWPCGFSTFSMQSKPMLTDLTLTRVGLRCIDILWNNLTAASVNDIGLDDCLELIRRAPLLETLTLQTINSSSDVFPIPDTRILHLHLHALELLEIWKEAVLTGILDSLCLPSLEQWIHNRSHFPLNNMISFGCLSPCLKKLEIDIEHVDYHQLTRFLSRLSSLESCAPAMISPKATTRSSSICYASLPNLHYSFPASNPWSSSGILSLVNLYLKYSPYHIGNP